MDQIKTDSSQRILKNYYKKEIKAQVEKQQKLNQSKNRQQTTEEDEQQKQYKQQQMQKQEQKKKELEYQHGLSKLRIPGITGLVTESKLLDYIQQKEKEVENMNQKLIDASNTLKQFYLKLNKMIKLDDPFDKEWKGIEFIKDYDKGEYFKDDEKSNQIDLYLNNIMDIIENIMDLRQDMNAIQLFNGKQENKDVSLDEEEKDLYLLYQEGDKELKISLRTIKQLSFELETYKKKFNQSQEQNQLLINKATEKLQEFREDNMKLLNIVSDKETDIKMAVKDAQRKKEKIKELEDERYNQLVLKLKIQEMDDLHQQKQFFLILCQLNLLEYNKQIKSIQNRLKKLVTQEKIIPIQQFGIIKQQMKQINQMRNYKTHQPKN